MIQWNHMWKMATGKESHELSNKENRDLKWKSKIFQVERQHQRRRGWQAHTAHLRLRDASQHSQAHPLSDARIVSPSLILHTHIWLKFFAPCHPSSTCHPCVPTFSPWSPTLFFPAFLLSIFLFSFFHLSDEQQPELHKMFLENLHNSGNNGSEGTYDVPYLTTQTQHGKKDWNGSKVHRNTEPWTELMVSQWNSSEISSQDCIRCNLVKKSKSYCWDQINEHQRISQERLSSFRCSTTSHGDHETMNKECESNARLVSLFAKRFGTGQWSFLGPGSEKKWSSISADSPQGEWDDMSEFAKSGHPIFRATSPLSRGQLKSNGHGKLSIHYRADLETIKTFSHSYFCKSAQSLRRQSLIFNGTTRCERAIEFFIRAKRDQVTVPLDNDNRAHNGLLLHKYGKRTEKLSQQDKLWQYLQWVGKEGEPGCPKRVSGRHVVRWQQSSPIPAQASRVSVAVRGAPR